MNILKNLIRLSIVLFLSVNVWAGAYEDALSHASKAFYIQSGTEAKVNYFTDKLSKLAQEATINQLKDWGIEKPIGLLAITYKLYRNPQYTLRLPNNKSLTFQPDRVILNIGF